MDPDGAIRCYGSSRRWTNIKRALAFCELIQDGDADGCLHLKRLPTAVEAEAIRVAIGIRKRRHLSADELEARKAALVSARSHLNHPSRREISPGL